MIKRIFAKDADYQRFEVLKTNRNKRFRYGAFLVEGVRNINEALTGAPGPAASGVVPAADATERADLR